MKLLAVCDSPTEETGFARVAQNLIDRWLAAGVEVEVWGINTSSARLLRAAYRERLPCKIWPAGQPWYREENLQLLLGHLHQGDYTHLWVMQDHFLLAQANFPRVLRELCARKKIRSLYYVPVDAAIDPRWAPALEAFDVIVAYTPYGVAEIQRVLGRVRYPEIPVLPHGVDTAVYHPLSASERAKARAELCPWVRPEDLLLLGVGAHHKRKDWPRALALLAELRRRHVPAKLLLHTPAANPSEGTDLEAIGYQLGLRQGHEWEHTGRYFDTTGRTRLGEADLARLYAMADLVLSTSLGEGWGFSATEGLACGTPVALPAHTACLDILESTWAEIGPQAGVALPVEPHGMVMPWDNARVRPPVEVNMAAFRIRHWLTAYSRPRVELSPALLGQWSWDRIAAEWLKLFENPPTMTPPLYLEFGGGLGDVFNGLFHRGAAFRLDELGPDERAVVCLITHNPMAAQLWEHHPKRTQIKVLTPGYWTPEEDTAKRRLHGLPPPGALWRLPELSQDQAALEERERSAGRSPQFYEHPADQAALDQLEPLDRYVVIAAGAGLPNRNLPQAILDDLLAWLEKQGIASVLVGRDYERHGRFEPVPAKVADGTYGGQCINLINQLSVPGTARVLAESAALITAHSCWNILAWHWRLPQLLLHPADLPHKGDDEWSFGFAYPETLRGTFEEYAGRRDELLAKLGEYLQ